MQKREAAFTTRFQKWARKNLPAPAVFEVKQTTKDCIPFSSVRSHQKAWLLAAMSEVPACWKIPDVGAAHKPFDVIMVGVMDAYVVIQYPDGFVVIGADRFFDEEEKSARKSLTYERAKRIAAYCSDSL